MAIDTITSDGLKEKIRGGIKGKVHLIRELHPMQGDPIDAWGALKYSDKLGVPYLMSEEGTYPILGSDILVIEDMTYIVE